MTKGMLKMNRVCNFCKYQKAYGKDNIQCSLPYYSDAEGYAHFKLGCRCKYDSDLLDMFEPRIDTEEPE